MEEEENGPTPIHVDTACWSWPMLAVKAVRSRGRGGLSELGWSKPRPRGLSKPGWSKPRPTWLGPRPRRIGQRSGAGGRTRSRGASRGRRRVGQQSGAGGRTRPRGASRGRCGVGQRSGTEGRTRLRGASRGRCGWGRGRGGVRLSGAEEGAESEMELPRNRVWALWCHELSFMRSTLESCNVGVGVLLKLVKRQPRLRWNRSSGQRKAPDPVLGSGTTLGTPRGRGEEAEGRGRREEAEGELPEVAEGARDGNGSRPSAEEAAWLRGAGKSMETGTGTAREPSAEGAWTRELESGFTWRRMWPWDVEPGSPVEPE